VENEMRRRRERHAAEYPGLELSKAVPSGDRGEMRVVAEGRWPARDPRWYRLAVAQAVLRLRRQKDVTHIPVGSVVVIHYARPSKNQPIDLRTGPVSPTRRRVARGPTAAVPEKVHTPVKRAPLRPEDRMRIAADRGVPAAPVLPPPVVDRRGQFCLFAEAA
jgi:hypothetical protein